MKTINLTNRLGLRALAASVGVLPFSMYTASSAFAAQKTDESKPNVLIFFTDDLGYGDLSFFNKESKIKTPNLDELAKKGVVFTDAHASSSVSTPSRYGLMTGEYSWKSRLKAGVLMGFSKTLIPEGKPTIASMLKSNGYQTACIGKWHLGMDFQTKDGKPLTRAQEATGENVDYSKPILNPVTSHGFDYYYGLSASLDIPPFLMIENDTLVKQPNIKFTVTHFTDFDDDDTSVNPFLRAGDAVFNEGPETFLPKLNKKVQEKLLSYKDSKNPFFIYYALPAPHAPIAPAKEYLGKSGIGAYGDYVVEIDDLIGKVVKTLKKTNQYNNTIILFSSDNGPEYYAYKRFIATGHKSSGDFKGIKRDLWEGGHRVPFIVSWPKGSKSGLFGEKGTIIDKTVCLSDIYATLADITGHKMQSNEGADSYSLLPLVTGKGSFSRDYTIHHSGDGKFAIRKGDWVLVDYGLGDANHKLNNPISAEGDYYKARGYSFPKYLPNGELYNLKQDPEERLDAYKQNPRIVKELTDILIKATRGHKTYRSRYENQRNKTILVR